LSLRISIPVTLRSLGRGFHLVPDEEIEREPSEASPPIDYAPLLDAGRRVALWLLDVARSHTSDPLDHTAIDRVQRAVMLASVKNSAACVVRDVSEEDLLTVASILIMTFGAELGETDFETLAGSLYDAIDGDEAAFRSMVAETLSLGVAAGKRARSPKRGVIVAPVIVRRRPRIVDEDALADVVSTR
jgi:hypothetical protein